MTIVLVDLDGVVVDWDQQFYADLALEAPDLTFEKLVEFVTPTHLSRAHQHAMNKVKTRPGFYYNMKPIEGALDAVQDMLDAGFEVRFCSSPETKNATCESDKKNWLIKHGNFELAQRLILTRDKTLVHGDFLIDDRPDIKGVHTPSWEHVVYTQHYNEHLTEHLRMNDWSEWTNVIQERSK